MIDQMGLVIGRFQPITLMHKEIIDTALSENDTVVVFVVHGKKTSIKRSPFPFDLQREMFNVLYGVKIDVELAPTGFYPDLIENIDQNNFVLYCGEDRYSAYKAQRVYLTQDKQVKIKNIPRVSGKCSGTRARQALIDNDYLEFTKLVPAELWGYFHSLRKIILTPSSQ